MLWLPVKDDLKVRLIFGQIILLKCQNFMTENVWRKPLRRVLRIALVHKEDVVVEALKEYQIILNKLIMHDNEYIRLTFKSKFLSITLGIILP